MLKFELLILLLCCFNSYSISDFQKVCKGTNSGQSFVGNSEYRYARYRSLYENCTHIDGNLELVFLENSTFDMSFLSGIREISGYLLLVGNFMDELPLYSLKIIRGQTLYNQLYSIYMTFNFNPKGKDGLKRLALYSFHEIVAGSIHIQENIYLCNIDTINWEEILMSPTSNVNISKHQNSLCGVCDDSCTFQSKKHCWGSSADMCQKFTKLKCDSRCESRCFGVMKEECCDNECASGCDGPQNNQCWACKSFENSGRCVEFCPTEFLYNSFSPTTFNLIAARHKFKYSFGYQCVDQCPDYMFIDKGACVSSCSDNKVPDKNGKCVPCDGACPKKCKVDIASGYLNEKNIHQYKDCTILQGAIKILDSTFNGDDYLDIPKMRFERLQFLESIEEVTDFVQIQVNNFRLKTLNFLKNLKIIHGQKLDRSQAALHISRTRLKSLDLHSLKEIKHGTIFVTNNTLLCYAKNINWKKIGPSSDAHIRNNRNESECILENEVCSVECTDDGCWGGDDNQCLNCRNSRFGESCIASCDARPLLYAGPTVDVCYQCHSQCKNSCMGPNSSDCDNCLHSKDGVNCVENCPSGKYADDHGICQLCHQNCNPAYGCLGPESIVGQHGCSSCILGMSYDGITVDSCLEPEINCSEGFYFGYVFVNLADKNSIKIKNSIKMPACIKCHQTCRACNGSGADACITCTNYVESSRCVDQCSSNHFLLAGESTCRHCHSDCLSCSGPSEIDCILCLHYKVYEDEEKSTFKCLPVCPSDQPQIILIKSFTNSELVCTNYDYLRMMTIIIIIGLGIICIFLVIAIFIRHFCRRPSKSRREQFQLQDKDELLQFTPSFLQPDMATLNLIKEGDFKILNVIGKGAFGAVYKGSWHNGKVEKNVAIKMLLEDSAFSSEQVLEEARIMATVDHEFCMSLLAVCCCHNFMLITELMPLGSLHDYLRKQRNAIGAVTISTWIYQIAQGMAYLEQRNIVHRDLATRNILVESHKKVMITDFGLARIRDCAEPGSKVKKSCTMMPIKWLAYECLIYQTFTSKSDVWSYGVTLWEILTFGARPYEFVDVCDMAQLLQSGQRLPQPEIAKNCLYMIIQDCWSLKPDLRPSFHDLVDIMKIVSICPKEYLLLPLYVKESVTSVDEGYKSERGSLLKEELVIHNLQLCAINIETNSYKNETTFNDKYYNSCNDVFLESNNETVV